MYNNFLLPKEAGLDVLDNESENLNNDQNDIYKPSGLHQVFYDEKKNDRKRKYTSISKIENILEDLKGDSDAMDSEDELPKEEKFDDGVNSIAKKKIKQRAEFEEETFTRTVLTKKQKKLERRILLGQYIDPEVEGEEIMRLLNDEDDKDFSGKKKHKNKKKHQKGSKKHNKGFKKFGKNRTR